MTSQPQEILFQEMQEAVMLPPEHPRRHQVEAAVANAGVETEELWLALLQEDEHLRLELQRVEEPDGLESRLLKIPDELPMRKPVLLLWPALWAAASILVTVGLVYLFSSPPGDVNLLGLRTVALMAADDHANDRHLEIITREPRKLEAELLSLLPFKPALPEMKDGLQLAGGRRCKWGGCPVAYSLWQRNGETYSLIQFSAEEFHLPATMGRKKICCEQYSNSPFDVVIWTSKGRGYAIISTHKAMADFDGEHMAL